VDRNTKEKKKLYSFDQVFPANLDDISYREVHAALQNWGEDEDKPEELRPFAHFILGKLKYAYRTYKSKKEAADDAEDKKKLGEHLKKKIR